MAKYGSEDPRPVAAVEKVTQSAVCQTVELSDMMSLRVPSAFAYWYIAVPTFPEGSLPPQPMNPFLGLREPAGSSMTTFCRFGDWLGSRFEGSMVST